MVPLSRSGWSTGLRRRVPKGSEGDQRCRGPEAHSDDLEVWESLVFACHERGLSRQARVMEDRARTTSPPRFPAGPRRESGQALLLALGGAVALIAGALALVAIAGAVTGKGRVQRAADLAAISAARSMRDDLPGLLSPPRLPNGLPNPAHIDKAAYLARARTAAVAAARANGVVADRLDVSFPDLRSFAP